MKTRVLVHVKPRAGTLFKSVGAPTEAHDGAAREVLKQLRLDPAFQVPHPAGAANEASLFKSVDGRTPFAGGYLSRAELDEEVLEQVRRQALESDTLDLYADATIAPAPLCATSPPMGTAVDVANRLGYAALQAAGMDGRGVMVAIVDTGFNLAYLNALGVHPSFDPMLSWSVPGAPTPGQGGMQNGMQHGTMSAYDACIAAPRCTLLDVPVLSAPTQPGGPQMQGLLSDAVLAYSQLLRIRQRMPERPLVVNNSWAMYSPSWDWPVGSPGNYSANPDHPFNLIVAALDRAGADIVFATGNCGALCPDDRCQGVTHRIYGAASSDSVLSVAGVDVSGTWLGYSTQGPGLLTAQKPDVAGFSQFVGSGVWRPETMADSGTSAAAPVVSGLLAALRTHASPEALTPAALRDVVRETAVRAGGAPFDFDVGWGVVNGPALAERLSPARAAAGAVTG